MEDKAEFKSLNCLDTAGGLGKYAYCLQMPETDFIKFISNKTILDLGSGKGGFAKECASKNIPVIVSSVNPKFSLPGFRKLEKESTVKFVDDPKKIKEVQKKHDEHAIAGFGQNLPYKNESFDLIFDIMAVSHYSDLDNFRESAQEMYRVAKKGGEIIIYADFSAEFDNEKEYKNKSNVLKEIGISYKEMRESGYGVPNGFRITKP